MVHSSGGTGSTQNPGLWYLKYRGEMGSKQIQQGFSSYFAIFDDLSKWSVPKVLWNFENSSDMANK